LRADYISFNPAALANQNLIHNFQILPNAITYVGGTFDFNSIMMYAMNAGALPGQNTLSPVGERANWTQSTALSFSDVYGLRELYDAPYDGEAFEKLCAGRITTDKECVQNILTDADLSK
jgi:hypothetical protein